MPWPSGSSLVAAGRLGDDLGRRRNLHDGLVLFFVMRRLFRGAAQSGAWLVASRFGVACSRSTRLLFIAPRLCLRTGGAASGNAGSCR